MMQRSSARVLGAAVLATLSTSAVHAQVSGDWLLTSTGSFSDANNWSPSGVPNGGTIGFSNGAGGTVINNGSIDLSGITFNSATRAWITGGPISLDGGLLYSAHINLDSVYGTGFASLAPEISATLSGSAGLIKTGFGAVYLLNSSNNFTGGVNINSGTLQIGSDASLGNAANTVTLNGAALQNALSNTISTSRSFILGTGTSTIAGAMTIGGVISGNGNLHLTGEGETLTAANTYNGQTIISGAGTAGVTLSGSGALLNSQSISVISTQLLLSNYTQNVQDRIADKAALSLHAGTLGLEGNPSANTREAINTLTLDGGGNAIRIANGSTTFASLSFNALTRNNHATLAVQSPGLGLAGGPAPALFIGNIQSLLVGGGGNNGTTNMSILPFAVEDSTFSNQQLMTAVGTSLRPLFSSEYETNSGNWTSTTNAKLAADTAITAPTTVNALLNNANTLSGGATLTVASGLIAGSGTISCPVSFGSREGVILSSHLPAPISGSGGVTYDLLGGGVPIVTLYNANTYSGQTTLNGGTYIINASVAASTPSPFGSDSSAIVLAAGATPGSINSTNSAITISRGITVDASLDTPNSLAPSITGSFAITGTVTLNGPLRLSNSMNLSGLITGPGAILDTFGQSNVTLSGINNYTGGTVLRGGTLNLGSNAALGNGTLTLSGINSIAAKNGIRSLNNALFFDPSTGGIGTLTFPAASPQVSFSGPVDLGTAAVHINTLNGYDVLSGTISNGGLFKEGSGTLYTGPLAVGAVYVNNGVLQLGNDAPSRTGNLSISNGSLQLGNGALIETYSANASPISQIRTYVNNHQITSSASTANVTGIGYVDNSRLGDQTFFGAPVAGRSILIANTYFGDANLDGKVDVVDLGLLANHWQQSGYWQDGDFNYDGTIDVVDLGELASNWQKGVSNPSSMTFAQALAEVGLGQTAVPEPTMLGVAAAMLLAGRRRRR